MTLQHHTTNLELSKRLKELGVVQKSNFYLVDYEGDITLRNELPNQRHFEGFVYSAYLASELGEMLQESPRAGITLAYNHVFNVIESNVITTEGLIMLLSDPNLVAKMLIYLLENKIVDVETINNNYLKK